jgi:hypothetical protein
MFYLSIQKLNYDYMQQHYLKKYFLYEMNIKHPKLFQPQIFEIFTTLNFFELEKEFLTIKYVE